MLHAVFKQLKSKHMVLAMFIAPVLAIMAYFATDILVSPKAHSAQKGESYPLAAKSNCRYESGMCTLKNGNIEIHLHADVIRKNNYRINAQSHLPIQNMLFATANEHKKETQQYIATEHVKTHHNENNYWKTERFFMEKINDDSQHLRVVFTINDTYYFAELPTLFLNYATGFSQEKFAQQTNK